MKRENIKRLSYPFWVVLTFVTWLLLDKNLQIIWLISGIMVGAIGELIMLRYKRETTYTTVMDVLAILFLMAVIESHFLHGLMGFAAGLFLPYVIVLLIYQIMHKKCLTLDEVRALYSGNKTGENVKDSSVIRK